MKLLKLDKKLLIILGVFMLIDPVVMNWLFKIHFFVPLAKASNYLLLPTLFAGIINLFFVCFIIFYLGKINLNTIFLSKDKIIIALLPLTIIVVLSNLAVVILNYNSTGQIMFIDKTNYFIGRFAGQLFGNAPFEEIVFRGVFFVQLYLLLTAKTSNTKAIIFAVILSEMFFAIAHIPNRVWINKVDNLLFEVLQLFIVGIFLNLIFIYTSNLAYLIGIHALANVPFILFQGQSQSSYYATYGLIILVTLFWKQLVPVNQKYSIVVLKPENNSDD